MAFSFGDASSGGRLEEGRMFDVLRLLYTPCTPRSKAGFPLLPGFLHSFAVELSACWCCMAREVPYLPVLPL